MRRAVLRGEAQEAWAVYQQLSAPEGQDTLWAVRALLLLRREQLAYRLTQTLAARHEPGALTELARLCLFFGRPLEALRYLERQDVALLSPAEQALHWRTQGRLLAFTRSYRDGLNCTEQAWEALQSAAPEEIAYFRTAVLGQVAEFELFTGEVHRAVQTLELLHGRHDRFTPYLYNVQVESLLCLGRWGAALEALQQLDLLREAREQYHPRYTWSRYYLAVGQLDRAQEELWPLATAALEDSNHDLEFWCRLTLAALLAHRGDAAGTGAALLRAEELLRHLDSLEHAEGFRLRRAACALRLGAPVTPELLAALRDARDAHRGIDLLLDAGLAQLYLCEAQRRLGDAQAFEAEVAQLQELCARLRSVRFLEREWPLLPELRLALQDRLELGSGEREVLEVVTLGAERLLLGGRPVHIPMRRAVEMIAYLLQVGPVTLGQLLADVFGEMEVRAARNHFHQVRHEIARGLPQVRVLFDPRSREYRLETPLGVRWDVAEVRAGRQALGQRLFLPGSGSWWAEQVNAELQGPLSLGA